MADAFSVNEKVPTTNALYAVWRLTRVLKSAGWTVTQSSDGTSYGASDYWGTYAGLGTSAWIVLAGPGGRQLCFWRSTTSTDNGKIIYDYAGSFSFASSSASTPGTLPSTVAYVRGSSGTFNTWFGAVSGTYPVRWLTVCAKDVADGSFWILGSSPQAAGGQQAYHTLGFFSLYTENASDLDPYAFYTAGGSATSDTLATGNPNATLNGTLLVTAETYWVGWARNLTWSAYRTAVDTNIPANARSPYMAGNPFVLMPFRIAKSAANVVEVKGVPKHARTLTVVDRGVTFSEAGSPFKWVCIGDSSGAAPGCVFFWDGKTPLMAYEY